MDSNIPVGTELVETVRSELVCYYQADELPPEWSDEFLAEELPTRAAESAERLQDAVESGQQSALVELLTEAASNPTHPLVVQVSKDTLLNWGQQRNWPVMQTLLRAIATKLSAIQATVP